MATTMAGDQASELSPHFAPFVGMVCLDASAALGEVLTYIEQAGIAFAVRLTTTA
jgi:hypothetical protein